MTPPLVTIVIPTFNQGQYLPACVDHCLFQSYPNLELIIVDGGSRDNTKTYLAQLTKKIKMQRMTPVSHLAKNGEIIRVPILTYPQNRKIKILSFKEDIGATRTYNEGLKKVTGEYCTYVAGDDLLFPHMIEELVEALEAERVDFVYSDMNLIDDNGCIVRQMKMPYYDFKKCFVDWFHLGVSKLYRTELHKKVGLMDENYTAANDYDHYLRFAMAGCRFYHLPRILYSIRHHGDSRKTGQHTPNRYKILLEESKTCAKRAHHWINKHQVLPFDLKSPPPSSTDSWYLVSHEDEKEFEHLLLMPTSFGDKSFFFLNRAAPQSLEQCFDLLAQKQAGSLFPFQFHSKYIQRACIKERMGDGEATPEQILFWLLESGVDVGYQNLLDTTHSKTSSLHNEKEKMLLAKHFFFHFSSFFDGISHNRFPDRFSYQALFWEADNEDLFYKLYRYPDKQPQGFGQNPIFSNKLTGAAKYCSFGHYRSPIGTIHIWLALEKIKTGINTADWAAKNKNKRVNSFFVFEQFAVLWNEFISYDVIPADLSLSNSLIDPKGNIRIIDLETVIPLHYLTVDKAENRRPILCLLAILYYFTIDTLPESAKNFRFDAFRDKYFIPQWKFSSTKNQWTLNIRSSSAQNNELIFFCEKMMNCTNSQEIKEVSNELILFQKPTKNEI